MRLRGEYDAEIASENRAVARIEENIETGAYLKTDIHLKACAYCPAIAVIECDRCGDSLCEDDSFWHGINALCPECLAVLP